MIHNVVQLSGAMWRITRPVSIIFLLTVGWKAAEVLGSWAPAQHRPAEGWDFSPRLSLHKEKTGAHKSVFLQHESILGGHN